MTSDDTTPTTPPATVFLTVTWGIEPGFAERDRQEMR